MNSKHSDSGAISLESLQNEVHSLRHYISRSLKSQLSDTRADIFYQAILERKVFNGPYSFPFHAMTSWAVTAELACWLYDTVLARKPKAILEFGSGVSTLVLAIALERSGGGTLTAVEHDETYYKKTLSLLREAGLEGSVNLLLAPLAPVHLNGEEFNWYAITESVLEKYHKEGEVDLLLVDGPPAASGPRARFPAYPVAKRFLTENALVLLDDAERPDEKAIADAWIQLSDGALKASAVPVVRRGPLCLSASAGVASPKAEGVLTPVGPSEPPGGKDGSSDDLEFMVSALADKGLLRAEVADSLIIRHKYFVEKLINRHRLEFMRALTDLADSRARADALASDVESSRLDNSRLSAELADAKRLHLDAVNKIGLLESTVAQLGGERDRLSTELSAALSRATEADERLTSAHAEIESSKHKYELLESECLEAVSANSVASKRISTLDEQTADLEGKLVAITASRSAEVAERDDRIARLEKSFNNERASLRKVTLELAAAREEINTIKAAESSTRKELQQKIQHLVTLEDAVEVKLREVFGLVKASQASAAKATAIALMNGEQVERTKKHLSYRLGAAMIKNSASASGWMSMPWALSAAHRAFRAERAADMGKPLISSYLPKLQATEAGVVFYAESKWQKVYFDPQEAEWDIWASVISVRNQGKMALEWQIGVADSDLGVCKIEVMELTDGISTRLSSLQKGVEQFLQIRKTRGAPALLKIERRPSVTPAAGLKAKGSTEVAAVTAKRPLLKGLPAKKNVTSHLMVEPLDGVAKQKSVPAVAKPMSSGASEVAKEPNRTVLLDAHKMIEAGDVEKGMAYAKTEANDIERPGISILEANQLLQSDEAWLKSVNKYLSPLGISPLALKEGPEDRFFRLYAEPLKPIKRGPLVTVIMPAYNCAHTLEFAANSILQQRWRPLELIIVDDCSDDDTWEVMRRLSLQDPRVKILRNPINCGPYVSKNRALDIAQGEYVTGHDSDDWAHPERLSSHLAAIQADPQPVLASVTKMLRLRNNGKFDRISASTINTHDGVMQIAFIATLFKTDFLRNKLGHWDCVRFGADSEIINRCKSLLGDRFIVYEQLGMLCLDSDQGLTAHPLHGTRGRTSQPRKDYKKSFLSWHSKLRANDLSYVLPFPHWPRNFAVPDVAAVGEADLKRIVDDGEKGRKFDLDVCIVTDLRFPGGNASSTLDELNTCLSENLRVKVFHCPSQLSEGKPISDRYYSRGDYLEVQDFDITRINTKVLIVRNPMVVCSAAFARLSKVITTERAVYVINNSRYRGDGEDAFHLENLNAGLKLVNCPSSKVYPLGPRIRRELDGEFLSIPLADTDWHPLFDSSYYRFLPKRVFSSPKIIGRHGRDHIDKWPRSENAVLQVYPDAKDVRVRILGGASVAAETLGRIPENWEVLPFGALAVPEFLAELDVFVYFPSEDLNEAFGRTVMEAIFSGVPCVLPFSFRESFGDLAFYTDVAGVQAVVDRLGSNDIWRRNFVEYVQRVALFRFDSKVLINRFKHINSTIDLAGRESRTEVGSDVASVEGDAINQYRSWVESGAWPAPKVL